MSNKPLRQVSEVHYAEYSTLASDIEVAVDALARARQQYEQMNVDDGRRRLVSALLLQANDLFERLRYTVDDNKRRHMEWLEQQPE